MGFTWNAQILKTIKAFKHCLLHSIQLFIIVILPSLVRIDFEQINLQIYFKQADIHVVYMGMQI